MAKVVTRRAMTKRKQVTDAARALFLAHGYAGTSMDAVTAAAGVSKQTLYSYFPSKTELLTQIVLDDLQSLRLDDLAAFRFDTRAEFRRVLVAWATVLIGRAMQEEVLQLYRLVVSEAVRLPELCAVMQETVSGQLLRHTESMIRRAVDRGLARTARPDLSARMFLGSVLSFVTFDGLLRCGPGDGPDLDALAYIVDAFLMTIDPHDDRPGQPAAWVSVS